MIREETVRETYAGRIVVHGKDSFIKAIIFVTARIHHLPATSQY